MLTIGIKLPSGSLRLGTLVSSLAMIARGFGKMINSPQNPVERARRMVVLEVDFETKDFVVEKMPVGVPSGLRHVILGQP